jgi:tRNA/rRNA methyltransferase
VTSFRDHLTVVLHQIRSPDNLGAVARLMANFGFTHLTLSQPVTYAFRAAHKLAVGAEHLLDGMQLCHNLPEALRESVYACGTTSRRQVQGRVLLGPKEAASKLAREARRGRVALVLGGEKRGLSDEDLAVCQDVAVIPTATDQPSMNVSQAAAVLLYLCMRAQNELPAAEVPLAPGASLETAEALKRSMRAVLLGSTFLNPQAPDLILGELTRSLLRAALSQREAELWLSAFRHLERSLASTKS